ncbi:T7SS effector LXG polymorphic toxin, partial [Staphylococcus pettenkoferi]
MSIDMYLRKSEDQSSKVEKTSKDLTDKYDELQNAISQFVNESELKGKAYDSGKQFFSTVIQPLTDSIKTLGDLTE